MDIQKEYRNRITAFGTNQDLFNTICRITNCSGNYIETSRYDDWSGVLHCDKCNHQIQRYNITIKKIPTTQSSWQAPTTQSGIKELWVRRWKDNEIKSSYNYQAPVQTDFQIWSVFIRKFINNECVAIIEHKFSDRESAETFSKNNWNLGEYF